MLKTLFPVSDVKILDYLPLSVVAWVIKNKIHPLFKNKHKFTFSRHANSCGFFLF